MAKPTSSRSHKRSASPLLLLACCLPAHAALAPPAQEATAAQQALAEQVLYLEVELNRQAVEGLHPFVYRGDQLFARADTLVGIGFTLPALPQDELVALDQLDGVEAQYDASLQRIALSAPLSKLELETTRVGPSRDQILPASNAPGLLLNYDFYASHGDSSSNATAYGELRAFGRGTGVFSTSAVTRAYKAAGSEWRGDSVRLDSQWRWSFQRTMLSLAIGDTYSGNLAWTRAVRLGGFRLGRDFGLQPYRVTTPLPTFLGEVAVPSEVELYVNGIKQYSGELPVGPFQLTSQPSINGLGNARMVITDAFGAVRTVDFPFYAAQELLAGGLSDWSISAGLIREDYGLRSFSYGDRPVASGDIRYGVTDALTLEAHGEATEDLANAGAGAVWSMGRAGVVSASLAESRAGGLEGRQAGAAYSWTNARFNLALSTQRTDGDYRDVAAAFGQDPARTSDRALVGWNSERLGSFGATYLNLRYPGEEADRYASAYWNRNFGGRWAMSFNYNQNLDESDDRSFYLAVSISLGDRRALNTSVQRNGDRDSVNMDLNQSVSSDGGLSWRLRAGHGEGDTTGLAEAGWLGDHGRVNGGIASTGGRWHGYAGASGGLVLMSGDVFAGRSINDAFAVVSTDGIAGVPVKLENRLFGTTNDKGLLLVTPLNAWQRNRLAIDPLDLPANLRLGQVEQFAVPSDRAGTVVEFAVEPVRAAVVVLHDASGQPIAPGSSAILDGAAATFVGYGGEVYLDTLSPSNVLHVTAPGGACSVTFDYPTDAGPIPRLGPLSCIAEPSP